MRASCVGPLVLGEQALASYSAALQLPSPSPSATTLLLARAIASSPQWSEFGRGVLLATAEPKPALWFVGFLEEQGLPWIEAQTAALESALSNLQVYDLDAVGALCVSLADSLVEALGDRVQEARFLPTPTGGLLVLGWLGTLLQLEHHQLTGPVDPDRPVVLVDDCAISGFRLRESLASLDHRDVTAAVLFAPKALRTAALEAATSLRGFLAAADLEERRGFEISEGDRRRWFKTSGASGFWVGATVPFAMPWNEPERGVWNPALERYETGWHLVPSDFCWKHRQAEQHSTVRATLLERKWGGFEVPDSVVFADLGEEGVVLVRSDSGRAVNLKGTASAFWRELGVTNTIEQAFSRVAAQYGAEPAMVAKDGNAWLEQILDAGLLTEP